MVLARSTASNPPKPVDGEDDPLDGALVGETEGLPSLRDEGPEAWARATSRPPTTKAALTGPSQSIVQPRRRAILLSMEPRSAPSRLIGRAIKFVAVVAVIASFHQPATVQATAQQQPLSPSYFAKYRQQLHPNHQIVIDLTPVDPEYAKEGYGKHLAEAAGKAMAVMKSWTSFKDIVKIVDQLVANDDRSAWSIPAFTRLRTALTLVPPPTSSSATYSSTSFASAKHPGAYRADTLFDRLVRDLNATTPADLATIVAAASATSADSLPPPLAHPVEFHRHLQRALTAHMNSSWDPPTLAVEVGKCGPARTRVRRLWVDFGGCLDVVDEISDVDGTDGPVDEDREMMEKLDAFNGWGRGGVRSCRRMCRDGVERIVDGWKARNAEGDDEEELESEPTRLLVFTPIPLSHCTAVRHLVLDPAFATNPAPLLTPLSQTPIWHQDDLAVIVGDGARRTVDVEAAVASLPISDRAGMRLVEGGGACEDLLDTIDWAVFGRVYSRVMNGSSLLAVDGGVASPWPTFDAILGENLVVELAAFRNMTCPAWHADVSIRSKSTTIPTLEVQGPDVETVFDVIHVALTMASLHPQLTLDDDADVGDGDDRAPSDTLLRSIASLCSACRVFPNVSYELLHNATVAVLEAGSTCKGSVVCEVGSMMASLGKLEAKKVSKTGGVAENAGDEDEQFWAIFGSKKEATFGKTVEVANQTLTYFERCTSGSTLHFTVPVSTIRSLNFPKPTKKSPKPSPKTVLLTSLVALGEPYKYVSANLSSPYSNATAPLPSVVANLDEASTLRVNVTLARDLWGELRLHLNVSHGNARMLDNLNVTFTCGYTPSLRWKSDVAPPLSLHRAARSSSGAAPSLFGLLGKDDFAPSSPLPFRHEAATHRITGAPLEPQAVSFLAARSSLVLLQNALVAPSLPPPLAGLGEPKAGWAVSDVCEMRGVIGSLRNAERIVLGRGMADWEAVCVEDLGRGVGRVGVRTPSVWTVTRRGGKARVVVVNVDWVGGDEAVGEMVVLLDVLERVRMRFGSPLIVGGVFDADLGVVMEKVAKVRPSLVEVFHPPTMTGRVLSHVWAPMVAPGNGYRPRAETLGECLVDGFGCEEVKDGAKAYRKQIGSALAEDRLLARRVTCAREVSTEGHIPMVYEVEQGYLSGGERLKMMTFNMGDVSTQRILDLNRTGLFDHFSTFDVLVLQTPPIAAAKPEPVKSTADSFVRLLNDALRRNRTSSKISFVHSLTSLPVTANPPAHLHILIRTSPRLRVDRCVADVDDVLGCRLAVGKKAVKDDEAVPLIVAAVYERTAIDGKRHERITARGGMKRVYGRLLGDGNAADGFDVPAVFLGHWGLREVLRGVGRDYADFKAGVESFSPG
ncbi:hypothetical protein HK101_007415 [Irineochytrium annulatum]|nr:hypothetical protein HK101_007415 [Irineochytrium annulatum]